MPRFAFALLLAACAASPAPLSSSPERQTPASGSEALGPRVDPQPALANGTPSGETQEQPPTEPPPGVPTLPAVSVRSVGLHVGGGPNDAPGKAPFVEAIEKRFPDFLRCYRFVSEPGKTGTFGLDLHVAREGGRPRIEQPRTALLGDEFRACMLAVFESIEFPAIKKPTVVSYSLRFSLDS